MTAERLPLGENVSFVHTVDKSLIAVGAKITWRNIPEISTWYSQTVIRMIIKQDPDIESTLTPFSFSIPVKLKVSVLISRYLLTTYFPSLEVLGSLCVRLQSLILSPPLISLFHTAQPSVCVQWDSAFSGSKVSHQINTKASSVDPVATPHYYSNYTRECWEIYHSTHCVHNHKEGQLSDQRTLFIC